MVPKSLFFIATTLIALAGIMWFFPGKDAKIKSNMQTKTGTLSFGSYITSNYSFTSDADLDGLSDGKEIIYGSDPARADTDGDGYRDGQEIEAGFDPNAAGSIGLSERKDASLSVRYFSWAMARGVKNPSLNSADIEAFLNEKGLLAFALPAVLEYDIRFTNNDPQKIADYLTFINNLSLPEEGSPYLAFAGNIIRNSGNVALDDILKKLEDQLQKLQKIPVPPVLIDLHRSYAGIWKELRKVFTDLKEAQRDPALIYLNQKKGEWLVGQVEKAQILRANLIAQLKLAPFTP